jgi:hypothetical protein
MSCSAALAAWNSASFEIRISGNGEGCVKVIFVELTGAWK